LKETFLGKLIGAKDLSIGAKKRIESSLDKESNSGLSTFTGNKYGVLYWLAKLTFSQEKYTQGLDILEPLLKEIRKIDEKLMLVELQLVESKIYHSLENLSKSKVTRGTIGD